MKILCVADHVDPLVYTAGAKERFKDVDIVLGAGDLPLEYLDFISSTLNKPILFVFGNHNLKELSRFSGRENLFVETETSNPLVRHSFGATWTGWKITRLQGLLVAGLGGSMRYNEGENQYSDFQMYLRVLRLLPGLLWNRIRHGRFLDVLLTHAPPRGIHDLTDTCHRGFKAFLPFMRFFKPRYLIHGHVHLYDLNAERVTRYGDTRVVNAYDHIVIDFEEIP